MGLNSCLASTHRKKFLLWVTTTPLSTSVHTDRREERPQSEINQKSVKIHPDSPHSFSIIPSQTTISQKHTRSEHVQFNQETTQSFVPGVHSAKSHLDKSQPVPFVKIAAAPHRLRVPLGKDPMSVGYATLEPECWPN